jgi:hypothetical protein
MIGLAVSGIFKTQRLWCKTALFLSTATSYYVQERRGVALDGEGEMCRHYSNTTAARLK